MHAHIHVATSLSRPRAGDSIFHACAARHVIIMGVDEATKLVAPAAHRNVQVATTVGGNMCLIDGSMCLIDGSMAVHMIGSHDAIAPPWRRAQGAPPCWGYTTYLGDSSAPRETALACGNWVGVKTDFCVARAHFMLL